MPAYNAMDFLPQTVSSVLAQTYSDFELIIVNDGSSDDIEAWTQSLLDPRVRLISKENNGPASARNTGLNSAAGTYIAFMDADDIWMPTKLAKQVAMLDEDSEIGLVYTWIALIDRAGARQGKLRKNSAQGEVWVDLLTHNVVECGSVALVRRDCFEAVGLFDERPEISGSEDWDMWLRIAARYRFGLIEEPLVHYRCHASSLSHQWKPMAKSFQMVLNKAFEEASEDAQIYKNKSYGAARLRAAWKALQSSGGKCEEAIALEREAIAYDPEIRHTSDYKKFKVALRFVQLFGLQPYSACRRLAYRLRDRTVQLVQRIKRGTFA